MVSSLSFVFLFVCVTIATAQRVVGGRSPVATNDETILEMANFAVSQLGSEYALGQIYTAEQQVVAGLLYYISASVTRTDSLGRTVSKTCDFQVLKQNWNKLVSLQKVTCTREITPVS